VQFFLDVAFVPSAWPDHFFRIGIFLRLGVSHDKFEIVDAEFAVEVEELLAEVQSDRALLVLERDV